MFESLAFPSNGTEEEKVQFVSNVLNIDGNNTNVHLQALSGGTTNSVYLFKTPEKTSIVRVYGKNTEEIINRKLEITNMRKAKMIKIYATFKNGMVCSFQKGKPLTLDMISNRVISESIATQLGKFHKSTFFNTPEKNQAYNRVNVFLSKINPNFSQNGTHLDVDELHNRFVNLQKSLNKIMKGRPVCLAHNDLCAGNILWDGHQAGFVDYEYSGYTWPEFDIANHFIEWCGLELDPKRYPSIEQQTYFLNAYLKSLYDEEQPYNVVEEWRYRVEKLVNLSNFQWGIWSFFQAENSSVDFPYVEYGNGRFKLMEYQLPLPEGHEFLKSKLVHLQ